MTKSKLQRIRPSLPRYVKEDVYREQLGGIAHSTLHQQVRAGKIPPPIKIGRRNLWDTLTLDDLGEE